MLGVLPSVSSPRPRWASDRCREADRRMTVPSLESRPGSRVKPHARAWAAPVELKPMDKRSERVQRRFDVPVMVAALLTIPLIVIEESDYGQPWDAIGVVLNWGAWLVSCSRSS